MSLCWRYSCIRILLEKYSRQYIWQLLSFVFSTDFLSLKITSLFKKRSRYQFFKLESIKHCYNKINIFFSVWEKLNFADLLIVTDYSTAESKKIEIAPELTPRIKDERPQERNHLFVQVQYPSWNPRKPLNYPPKCDALPLRQKTISTFACCNLSAKATRARKSDASSYTRDLET